MVVAASVVPYPWASRSSVSRTRAEHVSGGSGARPRTRGGSAARVCSPRRRTAAPPRGPARPAWVAVQHAREREQFGSPIGPFRTVEHLCVDGPARAGPVRAPGYGAAVTGDPAEIAGAAPLAEGAAVRVARDRLRLPGGGASPGRQMFTSASNAPGSGPPRRARGPGRRRRRRPVRGPRGRVPAARRRTARETADRRAERDAAHRPRADPGVRPVRDSSPGGVGARLGYPPWHASGSGTG